MLIPSNYKGVLLFDDDVPKAHIKLSTEKKALHKQVISLLQSNQGKNVSKDVENQRLVSCFIMLLNLDSNNHSNANICYKYFRLFQLSVEGKLITTRGEFKNKHTDINLIGMDNFWNTTCYLDSLLVAMFYSNSSFDYLLDTTDDPNLSSDFQFLIDRLKIMLRFIVNLLRAGEHININTMYQLLLVLNALGCKMVLSGKQQDSLQAFEFLAESLSLPLLTLKLDIIHTGKLNVNDDLRLIGERSLLISIPTNTAQFSEGSNKSKEDEEHTKNSTQSEQHKEEPPITLEECLNTYFNNSITVRRHLDKKLNQSSFSTKKSNLLQNYDHSTSDESLIKDKSEIDEYEKLGILTSSNPNPFSASTPSVSLSPSMSMSMSMSRSRSVTKNSSLPTLDYSNVNTDPIEMASETSSSLYPYAYSPNDSNIVQAQSNTDITPPLPVSKSGSSIDDTLNYNSASTSSSNTNSESTSTSVSTANINTTSYPSKPSTPLRTATASLVDYSPITPNVTQTDTATLDSATINPFGSFKNVNEKLERQRTRSSTLASVLNNVQVASTAKLSRRKSSISNAEVSLPAWMYLQLLPYYTDPEVKLTVENHEEYYRRRVSRTKTIDSSFEPLNDDNKIGNDGNEIDEESYFDKRFGSKRPVVPICLKRYTWNEKGQPVKIKRKVVIPEIIKYPYFVAEDRKKSGFVDFRRSYDHKAPCGSFMLVLSSCVCHRGNSVNSGHYVSVVRKKEFNIYNADAKSEWLIFNDMEIGKEKVKVCTFEEAMEKETPYILFYDVYEIKNDGFRVISGSKESFWSRKQSVNSGLSGYSEQTLQEEPHATLQVPQTEEVKSSPGLSTPTTAKHMMHLSLAGLTLSKSKSKNIGNEEDVIDEYYWYDGTTNYERNLSTTFKSTYSLNTNLESHKGSNNSYSEESVRSSIPPTNTEEYGDDNVTPHVEVVEVDNSNSTVQLSTTSPINGEIEYDETTVEAGEATTPHLSKPLSEVDPLQSSSSVDIAGKTITTTGDRDSKILKSDHLEPLQPTHSSKSSKTIKVAEHEHENASLSSSSVKQKIDQHRPQLFQSSSHSHSHSFLHLSSRSLSRGHSVNLGHSKLSKETNTGSTSSNTSTTGNSSIHAFTAGYAKPSTVKTTVQSNNENSNDDTKKKSSLGRKKTVKKLFKKVFS